MYQYVCLLLAVTVTIFPVTVYTFYVLDLLCIFIETFTSKNFFFHSSLTEK